MSKKTIYLLGILLTIIIGTLLNWWLCCSTCNINATNTELVAKPEIEKTPVVPVVENKVKEPTVTNPLTIKDLNGDFAFNSNENFNFNASEFSILEPISENIQTGVDTLKTYLELNPSKTIDITGYYNNLETNNSAFPNLGVARANAVKNYFTSKGISSKQINTDGALKDSLAVRDSIYVGPLGFNFNIVEETPSNSDADEIKALGDKIRDNPLVLYFNSGQSTINLTAEQRQKIADISKYLDKVDDAFCSITGHTDKTGRRTTNIKLAQGRADFAKDYLVQNGIPANKIKTFSEGPDSPIASNKTKSGRAKNRRTVVTIN